MPLYRPRESGYARAVGDAPRPEAPQSLMETSLGMAHAWDNSDSLAVETRTPWRLSLGEQATTVIPQGERVIITQTVTTPNGMFATETAAIDVGTGGLTVLQEDAEPGVGGGTDLEAQVAANQAQAAAEQAAQAQDAAWREATAQAEQQVIVEPPPSESAAPPAPVSGFESGYTEAPVASAPGAVGAAELPAAEPEIMYQTYIDPELGEITIVAIWDGTQWVAA